VIAWGQLLKEKTAKANQAPSPRTKYSGDKEKDNDLVLECLLLMVMFTIWK
jgi:hypothetical protein